ncbi:DegQ family serine endoprotease [soil metagenome]
MRRWLLVVPLLALVGLAPALARLVADDATEVVPPASADVEPAGPDVGAETPSPATQVQVEAQQDVDTSRRTAIVRAAERVGPSVVSVNVIRRETYEPRSLWESFFMPPGVAREVPGLGSGFIIDAQGLVLTNEHVVRGATELVVTLRDGRDFAADLIGSDDVTDLALLRLRDVGGALPVAPLGTSSNLIIGEWVVAIGNPFGFMLANAEATVTAGVVSGVNRNIIPEGRQDGSGWYLDMIQTDASINPGNSGGPLVNALGEVIGVNSSIISGSGGSVGLGFAIPIDRARRIARDLQRSGVVRRAWVGVEVAPHEPNRWGRSRQVRVAAVAAGSPAAAAGIRAGMIVESVGGRAVASTLDWDARLLDARLGESIDLVVTQDGRQRTVRVGTQDLPSLSAERVRALDEMELVTLTPAIRSERRVINENGALIVSAGEGAQKVGLRDGDVILQINRTPVRSAAEAGSLLHRLEGTRVLVRIAVERQGQLLSLSFYVR